MTHLVRAPETAMIDNATDPRMSTVPVSFWARMMRSGSTTTPMLTSTSRSRGSLSESCFSARTLAIMRMTAIFANSEGWRVNPPGRSIHAWAPAISEPTPGTKGKMSENTDTP
ncbi:unannotated protein [freshwater metagenome]|uniref:Unannotated protein n=1 Tax=freshwater metagenome TaxID=449393 RepID=A0A6J6U8P8_9ZZZZ